MASKSDDACACVVLVLAFVFMITAIVFYTSLNCYFQKCCPHDWKDADLEGMWKNLSTNVFGQHLAIDVATKSIKAHIRKSDPKKSLVLSYHGWTGSGKTYISQIIAHHLFQAGYDREFAHFFIATKDFPHATKLDEYKDKLSNWIRGNITKCQYSLFVFDELEKMPVGLLDVIKPFVDHYHHVDGVDSRRAIFIFLSNVGGQAITKITLQHWKSGKRREDLKLDHFSHILNKDAFNSAGGLRKCSLIDSNLIDHYVPFLPLEKQHIKLCIREELNRKNIPPAESLIETITNQLEYAPPELELYSTIGCKRIEKIVDLEVDF